MAGVSLLVCALFACARLLTASPGALAGLRIVQEILLAAERARQNGGPGQYVGDRVMEGLKLAALALTSHAIYCLHPE